MCKTMLRLLSVILVIVMVANMLPMQSFAADYRASLTADTQITAEDITTTDTQVIEEITEKRTEFSKEFLLSNGLHMAAVYPDPVHYEVEGSWEEIDNTLKTNLDGTYTNTAGVWDVRFPQQLTGAKFVTVTKDGYTLSFAMAGEIRSSGELATASLTAAETVSVNAMQTSTAKLQTVDMTALKESLQYAEMAPEKLQSRLVYENVYANTNIIYDLDSNKVKESIVLESYSSTLRGYRYTLNVGQLLPVLEEDGHIDFLDATGKTIVMTMPAPYLVDAANAFSDDIQVQLTGSGSIYTLTYLLPRQWLVSADRVWPVVLDPVVQAETNVLNIEDRRIAENASWAHNHHLLETGYDDTYGKTRSYLKFVELPVLTSSDVVVGATIHLYQPTTRSDPSMELCVEVRKVNQTWDSETITWTNQPTLDPIVEDYCVVGGTPDYYGWVVTDIVQDWYANGNNGLVFKSTDANESAGVDCWMQFCSSDYNAGTDDDAAPKPVLLIQFRNNNGLESYWDFTGSSVGRAGTGYVNSYTGNLVWVRDDIGFSGNRTPVSISHVYNANDVLNHDAGNENNNNSNDTAGNFFGMGTGWRTNFNQRLYQWTLDSAYYVWEDADGTDHYFKADDEGVLRDEDGLELTLTTNGTGTQRYCIEDKYGNKSFFDTYGRLTKQQNNQETKSSITVAYTTANGPLISTVTDGAGRVYRFTYNSSGLLTRIGYYSTGSAEISYVAFGYSGSLLTTVTDKDGEQCAYTYSGSLLASAQDIDGYKVAYTYNAVSEAWQPYRVIKVSEYDGTVQGGELTMEYAHNQTTFTDHNGNVEIMQFNDFGNTISIQDDEGKAQYAQYAFNTADDAQNNTDTTAKGNQLRLSSKLQNTVGNRLQYSSVENGLGWTAVNSYATVSRSVEAAYLGSYSAKVVSTSTGTETGIYGNSLTVAANSTYTFSAYVKTGSNSVYLGISDGSNVVTSEPLAANSDWTRLQVSYTNSSTSSKTLTVRLLTKGAGTCYIDCGQMEAAATASRYNLIENGDFCYSTTGWTNNGFSITAISSAAAYELQTAAVRVTGSPGTQKRLSQTVNISGTEGDSFILSGWAKGDSAPLDGLGDEARKFGMLAAFNYTDGTTSETFEVSFNPDADSSINWQYAAMPFVAEKDYSYVIVHLAYDYNVNTACFDGIQLYREEFGNSYTYDDEGNVTSVTDLQKQTTSYEYTNNDLTKQILPSGAKLIYVYDGYHNVTTATTETGVVYTFVYDKYGNNTSVSAGSGTVKLTSSAAYSDDGNRLVSTTDTAGKITTYGYNANTNVLEWVQYPVDTETTRTNYTYDSMYRLATAAATTDTDTALTAGYTYTDDLLTSITTGSTTYTFTYGDFALRSNVKIGDRTLASYSYTDDRNYDLDRLDYGNSDSVQYEYDDKGRVTSQTYEDGDTVTYAYDNSGALAKLYDSATGRTTTYHYDLTDRLMKYVESGTDYYYHSVGYSYDELNNLTRLTETIDNAVLITDYSYDSDNRIVNVASGSSWKAYSYDGYNRPRQTTTLHNGYALMQETLTYQGNTNSMSDRLSSQRIAVGNATIYNYYWYDENGNIGANSGSGGSNTYLYDSANQLIRENNAKAGKTWTWEYDDAGNILSRTEHAYTTGELGEPVDTVLYTYGDSNWGDLLTAYDGNAITYDAIGNPLTDGTWTYTWQHGRQLATMSDGTTTWTYIYNADGLRTYRSNGTTIYTYVYNGTQLSRMAGNNGIMYFSYDAGGSPLAVTWNNTVYYYITNAQGDVTGIVDTNRQLVVNYFYDAWGNIIATTGTMAATLGTLNPLRYRGYVYDTETGLYYVSSRYYDPEIGRFINADGAYDTNQGILGYNVYAYCLNNPVNMHDPDGKCSRFLGFLWKIDCKQASCPDSKNYVKPKAVDPIGSYNKGRGYVYVVTEDQLDIMEEREKNVVVIVDKRTSSDPNMQIRDSYRITKTKQQKEIAQLMLDYNTSNPVEPAWSRTLDSLVEEWKLHNFAYNLGYKQERTGDCDFNNADQGMGFWDFVGR